MQWRQFRTGSSVPEGWFADGMAVSKPVWAASSAGRLRVVAIYLSRAGVGSPSAGVSGAGSGTDERE